MLTEKIYCPCGRVVRIKQHETGPAMMRDRDARSVECCNECKTNPFVTEFGGTPPPEVLQTALKRVLVDALVEHFSLELGEDRTVLIAVDYETRTRFEIKFRQIE